MHKEKLGSKDDEPEIIQQTMSRMGGRRMSMVQKEEAMLECVAALALEEKANNQFIFITPTDLSSIKADQVKVCVWKMKPPREDRHTSANQTTLD